MARVGHSCGLLKRQSLLWPPTLALLERINRYRRALVNIDKDKYITEGGSGNELKTPRCHLRGSELDTIVHDVKALTMMTVVSLRPGGSPRRSI
ncbi:hypothetical protein BDBG_07468 [Blastomyces gilchristii SLH14081]|uniref:Uncharacterized protein n=1 Tax=Blastomyces gilchristii (strain SLH14081) TaxID=559298 RepID=A0A179UY99_BLAGS|nr:uncharacterized protein BDBG_07468 [Blastomyces gilchristii SLH14081]OAT12077.1 hypothetical protein BDBG_07468 [Blastomyces gilchristii SLH14081]